MRTIDVAQVLQSVNEQTVAAISAIQPQHTDDDSSIPGALRNWLVQLRLLDAVPFAYLVSDSALLPEESIRWFYLDRRWTDALVMGALAVGTANSDDRAQLAAAYDAIRDELDAEERQVRRGTDAPRLSGDGGPISGFLLRSQAVAGWPGMHVRAFAVDPDEADDARYSDDDPRRLRLLRLERLAPAVLLCLFDGIPEVVHLEEPRQGIQFGFTPTGSGTSIGMKLQPRDEATFQNVGPEVAVPFRGGASGVVNIKALEGRLPPPATGPDHALDSAEYALQLVRPPFRQVWGDAKVFEVSTVFAPTVSYQSLSETFHEVEVLP